MRARKSRQPGRVADDESEGSKGSSLVWIDSLPYRISRGDGQGGGGPISVAEMRQHLLLDSDEPVLAVGPVCHTDSAKAYRNLASPLYDGTLMDFEHLKLGHTCVKHKPPRPEFSKEIQTQVWSGNAFEEQIRCGGTQKLDGFFAGFRRDVGARALNSVSLRLQSK